MINLFWKQHGSKILTCVGALGVAATTIMAVKATPKAISLLQEAKEEKGEDLPTLETIRTAAPVYIPSVLIGVSTIACIFGANALNKKQQASMVSAYALLENSYKEYRNKVKDMIGEKADSEIEEEIRSYEPNEDEESDQDDKKLFLDLASLRYFESTMDEVVQKVTLDDGLECYMISMPFDQIGDYI